MPKNAINEKIVAKWKLDALDNFLSSLDDADKLSVHVSQVFDYADLLGIKALMFNHDIPKLLKVAHLRNWSHNKKWENSCPVCSAEKEISQLVELKN